MLLTILKWVSTPKLRTAGVDTVQSQFSIIEIKFSGIEMIIIYLFIYELCSQISVQCH